jgi:predicted nuclease of predicted toxin-antitoxin system
VKFLVDNQLPAVLARALQKSGVDCVHVSDIGLEKASDSKIWAYVAESRCILITKDEDFFHRAARSMEPHRIIWVRLGNCRNETLLAAFAHSWDRIMVRLVDGEKIIELRSP